MDTIDSLRRSTAWGPSPKSHWECLETAAPPLSLDLVKEHLRITHGEEDRILETLTECATQQWEEEHALSLRAQRWQGIVKAGILPTRLPRWHARETSVTFLLTSQSASWRVHGPLHLFLDVPVGTWTQIRFTTEAAPLSGIIVVEILSKIERLYLSSAQESHL